MEMNRENMSRKKQKKKKKEVGGQEKMQNFKLCELYLFVPLYYIAFP